MAIRDTDVALTINEGIVDGACCSQHAAAGGDGADRLYALGGRSRDHLLSAPV